MTDNFYAILPRHPSLGGGKPTPETEARFGRHMRIEAGPEGFCANARGLAVGPVRETQEAAREDLSALAFDSMQLDGQVALQAFVIHHWRNQ